MISYFGPSGSFTHEMALWRFGAHARLEAGGTISEVFDTVRSGRAKTGIVPIYNSTGGFVNDTVDELLRSDFVRSGCQVTEQMEMAIHLCLIGRGAPRRVQRVYSHPIPLGHSRGWVRRHHPHAELIVASSTSDAALRARTEPGSAAIASETAAGLYGLRVWGRVRRSGVQNRTQFITISKSPAAHRIHPRTAIGFGLAHRPGTLAAVLTELARSELNLTRIVSRPFPGKTGEYVFLVEFEGDRDELRVQSALQRVKRATMFLRPLGTYSVCGGRKQGGAPC